MIRFGSADQYIEVEESMDRDGELELNISHYDYLLGEEEDATRYLDRTQLQSLVDHLTKVLAGADDED